MRSLDEILSEVRCRISAAAERAGRDESEIEIIAVTKTHPADVVAEAYSNGLVKIGENKVQEAAWKKQLSPSGPQWHLIGHLQTNKVRQALSIFDYIHSVDSLKLIRKINSVAEELGLSVRILLEVNVSGEKSKTGMPIEEVDEAVSLIVGECSRRISLEGFMTMAPFSENGEDSRAYFRKLRELRDETEKKFSLALPHLSMGMSGDYEVAVEEGATMLRLGTILFGERPKIAKVSAVSEGLFSGLDSYSGAGPTVKVLD